MSFMQRLSSVLRRRDLNPEIDEELQFHIDERIAGNIAEGMSPAEARRDALRRFGGATGVREETHDANLVVALDALRQDVAIAARSLRRRPGFSLVVIATLALGIGATATVFTVVERLLLRPLPFTEPDRIYALSNFPKDQPFWLMAGLADHDYVALREGSLPFASTATFSRTTTTLTRAGDATRLTGATVTPAFFAVLGVNPALGRAFAPEDGAANAVPVVLLSDGVWRGRFGADRTLVNRAIHLDGVAHTVVGVLPPRFSYPDDAEFWTPFDVRLQRNLSLTRPVIARLNADATPASARAAFEAFIANRSSSSSLVPGFVPLREAVVGDVEGMLGIFGAAVLCLLLIACANVANLLLVRSVSRRQEIATRRALGASRGRIVRQLLTESALLSVLAGIAGVALALVGVPAVLSLVPEGQLPRASEIHVDGWVLAFTLAVALLTGLAIGLVPALYASRGRLAGAIKEGPTAASPASHRFRHALIVAEVGLALVLLIGAGLLGRSFLKLQGIDPGFRSDPVMTMSVNLPDTKYATVPQVVEFHDRVLSTLSAQPTVAAVALVNWLPFGNMTLSGDVTADGRPVPPRFLPVKAGVGPEYFNVMGIRLQAGRTFAPTDRAGAERVAIVSATVARVIWPNEAAIGRRISIESDPKPQDWMTVVGVVDDVKQNGLRAQAGPAVYLPYSQMSRRGWLSSVTYVARSASGYAELLVPAMRDAIRAVDPNQAPESMATMSDRIGGTIAEPRFQAKLISAFSFLAVALAAVGIYGVLAASVFERRREIGIRMALGADRRRVVAMMLRRALVLAGMGVALGLTGAYGVTDLLTKFLWQVPATDAATFALAAAALLAVAFAAGILPARRASRLDPITTLRGD
jgi:putative ABC transport system permease protein